MRLRSLMLAFAGLTACQPAENAVLLEVHTQAGISQMRVLVLSLDGPDTWTDPYETINMTAEEINADPLRVVVELDAPHRILVQVEALGMDGSTRLVATRCYSVEGVVRDEVQLVVVGGDLDMDGFVVDPATVCREPGVDGMPERTCDEAVDHVCPDDRAADCDDTDPDFHPGAGITCLDGLDQDCDGDIEEACADLDNDMSDSCPENPMGPCDCDDSNPSIHPGATDICNDRIDQDCSAGGDPIGDACCDSDEDGFCLCNGGMLLAPCLGEDCNDDSANAFPGGTEVCDAIDNDCNGQTDEIDECRGPDLDGDGVANCGREEPGDPCDCNDCDSAIYPGAREICSPRPDGAMGNTIDEDCDGTPDDGCPTGDDDGDGYGSNDCRDDDPFAFPHLSQEVQVDRCDDGMASTCIPGDPDTSCSEDSDGDGFTEPAECEGNGAIRPDANEECNGVDDDCDGVTDEVLDPTNQRGCGVASPINFQTSFPDCGGCRMGCDPATANACEAATCVCTTDTARAECVPGMNCCSDGCVDLQTTESHCGACGRVCGRNEECMGGECMCGSGPACGVGQTCCGGRCVDLAADPNNCGDCGTVCGAHADCNVGSCRCVDTASENWEDCDLNLGQVGGNGCESNINTDLLDCGGCGQACSTANGTPTCSGGNCSISCSAGFGDCDGNPRANGCENTLDSLSNCGNCGSPCNIINANPTCATDSCRVQSCMVGWGDCNGDQTSCETRTNTITNCGGCGVPCTVTGGTPDCADGSCGTICSAGLGDCDLNPLDCETPLNSTANCGGCRVACTTTNATPTCSTGSCRVQSCNMGFADCNMDMTSCETPITTTSNCGGCGIPCVIPNSTETCSTGACRVQSCDATYGDCDFDGLSCERRTNTLSDCGGCNVACSITNATATCATGACRVASCNMGFADCNMDGTSCETSTTTTSNCGGCGIPCSIANATENCSTGMCNVTTCDANYADCDMDDIDCEPLNADPNCGSCGNDCMGGDTCCGAGLGACVDLQTDEANCGSCGSRCNMGEQCIDGDCTCGATSRSTGPACPTSPNTFCCDPAGGGFGNAVCHTALTGC